VTLLISRTAINFGFYTLLGFLFFFVSQSLGISGDAIRTQTALLFLTFTLANVAGAVIAGKPIDRYDKRAIVVIANGVVAVGLVLLAVANSLPLAFVAAAVAGVAWGAYFIADWALACALLPRSAMASAMGIWNVSAAIPQIIAPVFTAPIVERINAMTPGMGPRVAIVLAIVEFTIGALWLYRLPRALASNAP
jgi:MFS family permease